MPKNKKPLKFETFDEIIENFDSEQRKIKGRPLKETAAPENKMMSVAKPTNKEDKENGKRKETI